MVPRVLGRALLLVALQAAVPMPPAHAQELGGLRFQAALSGAQVVPAVDAESRAVVRLSFDTEFSEARISFDIAGEPQITRARLHCGLPGEEGPLVLGLLDPAPLLDVVDGTDITVDNEDMALADCRPGIGRPVPNLAALAFAMREGLVYVQLDTLRFSRGELRGQFLEVGELGELELPANRRGFLLSP